MLSGKGSVYFVDIWLCGLLKLGGFIVFWRWLVRVVLGMVLFIFFLLALLRLVFGGILVPWPGLGLVCPCLVIWLVLFSISRLPFSMLGVTRLLLIFVAGKVFEVALCWIVVARISSLPLLMSRKGIRHFCVVLWLEVYGTAFSWGRCVVSSSLAGSVVRLMGMVIFC